MHELADQIFFHLKGAWRHRWYAAVFSWIIAVGGWVAVYLVPERYEASARIQVDTQTVLRPLLGGLTVQPNVEQVVAMMSRTLINRPNVEKVIRLADLDLSPATTVDREQLIARLANSLAIKSAGTENLYTITYTDKNPQDAKRVVQALLTLFVEERLGDQRKDSDAAQSFIDEQLKNYSEKLLVAENAITEFKRRHMGLMPGEGGGYYARLGEAKTALSQATLELKEAEDARDSIKKQLAGDFEIPSLLGDKDVGGEVNLEIDSRIQALEQKLDGLRLNYTDQHPDIVAVVRMIAKLKEQKKVEAKLRKPSSSAAPVQDPVYQQLTITLASAEANVAARKARVAEFSKRYSELRAAVNAVPQIEAEFTQLTRDYEVTRNNYQNLLSRRETARISSDMETKVRVTDFRVIDPPKAPAVPKFPNRQLLMSLVLLAALGGGLGGAILINQIRPTLNDEHRLQEVTGLKVLGTVVMAWTDAQKARRTRGLVALLISFASLLSAHVTIMALLMLTASRV